MWLESNDLMTIDCPGAMIIVDDPNNDLNVSSGVYLGPLTFFQDTTNNLYNRQWSIRVVGVKNMTLHMENTAHLHNKTNGG
ncbi:hypothetical protein R0K18_30090, partial [Pantoea sp. SIMBA_133]